MAFMELTRILPENKTVKWSVNPNKIIYVQESQTRTRVLPKPKLTRPYAVFKWWELNFNIVLSRCTLLIVSHQRKCS